ncbi:MAG: DNA polymerase III subunit beta [Methylobacterium sp.]|nr:DNA polymerase III subunit beta [Methylobacterium sp.]MCA3601714.1 DNA polymerase III subunit beta [Methylobacterium sp.]MCA3606337.1 DNA polymerase III subunit beta [Methylobacterium sp.]MCA3609123.1 DNA polymerase III subunit beta [Methylobacterium sp.]MCA3617555.1 DNA polymerase III subunit beta [Methylobacterium sp.]
MKVTVEQAALLKALGHVHRVVERRNTIPILANVLLRASDGQLALKATDLDIDIVETIAANVTQEGTTSVPAHVLHDIVRKLADGAQVSLEQDGQASQVTLRSGRSRFSLQTLPESDFPDLAPGEMSHGFDVAAADLRLLIEKTQFAISTEETRYYLNGIYLHVIDGKLRAVATDGHRLALADVAAPAGASGMPGVIVPRKTVSELLKLVSEASEAVTVELSSVKIRVSTGAIVLTSKLIDGTFPDYQRVIPQRNDKLMIVEREEFARSVDRVSTISSERGRAVKFALGDGRLTLSVHNPDAGQATEELVVDYEATPLEIGFNARYLLDIVSQLEGDTALVKLFDSGSPTLIQDREGAASLYVLMPMRV